MAFQGIFIGAYPAFHYIFLSGISFNSI